MSTKEFDVEIARGALARVEEARARANTWPSSPMREDVHAHEYAKDHAASLLGPALDALSAARKERDEARAARTDAYALLSECDNTLHGAHARAISRAMQTMKQVDKDWAHGLDVLRAKVFDVIGVYTVYRPPTLASLAERVKAIEERIGGKANE